MQNTGRKTAEKSFIVEALIISLSNFVVKIIGVLFKIPMTYILGVNMGIFNAAYSIYAMLFMLSTAGLPVAISRLVASANERGRPREIRRVYRLSVAMFGLIGLFCTLLLFFGAEAISNFSEHRDAALAMRVISPTLFLICISAAIRGYFQGLKNMYPTAISQFIEAFFKLAVGLGAVAVSKNLGASPAVQAAFGVSGLTVGVFLGTVFMVAYKHIYDRRNRPKRPSRESEAWRVLAKRIALIALPVTITSSALYLFAVPRYARHQPRADGVGRGAANGRAALQRVHYIRGAAGRPAALHARVSHRHQHPAHRVGGAGGQAL